MISTPSITLVAGTPTTMRSPWAQPRAAQAVELQNESPLQVDVFAQSQKLKPIPPWTVEIVDLRQVSQVQFDVVPSALQAGVTGPTSLLLPTWYTAEEQVPWDSYPRPLDRQTASVQNMQRPGPFTDAANAGAVAHSFALPAGTQAVLVGLRQAGGAAVTGVSLQGDQTGLNYPLLPSPVAALGQIAFAPIFSGAGMDTSATLRYTITGGAQNVIMEVMTTANALVIALLNQSGLPLFTNDAINNAELAATVTAAGGSAATLTLPSVAGKFHYLAHLEITRFATALLVAAAAAVIITSTNLSNNPAWTFPADAAAQGTVHVRQITPAKPIKSVNPATATTIVMPATTNVIWRASAFYHAE